MSNSARNIFPIHELQPSVIAYLHSLVNLFSFVVMVLEDIWFKVESKIEFFFHMFEDRFVKLKFLLLTIAIIRPSLLSRSLIVCREYNPFSRRLCVFVLSMSVRANT